MPLGQKIPIHVFLEANPEASLIDYMEYTSEVDVDIPQKPEVLKALGVESSSKISHPHIWTLLNKDHENYVHDLFRAVNKAA